MICLQWSLLLRILLGSYHNTWRYLLSIVRVVPIAIVQSFVRDVWAHFLLVVRLVDGDPAYVRILQNTTALMWIKFCVTLHAFSHSWWLWRISWRRWNHLIGHIDMRRRRENFLRVSSRVGISAKEIVLTAGSFLNIHFRRFVLELLLRNIWWLAVLSHLAIRLLNSFYSCRFSRCLWKLLGFAVWSEIISWLCWKTCRQFCLLWLIN